jgi:hypothetical protein
VQLPIPKELIEIIVRNPAEPLLSVLATCLSDEHWAAIHMLASVGSESASSLETPFSPTEIVPLLDQIRRQCREEPHKRRYSLLEKRTQVLAYIAAGLQTVQDLGVSFVRVGDYSVIERRCERGGLVYQTLALPQRNATRSR